MVDRELAARLVAECGDAIVVADAEGRIVVWNRGAEVIFGHPAEAAVGQSLDLIIPERLRERHWEGYRATMRTGETRYADSLLAVPAIHQDGRRLSIEFTVTLLPGPDGAPEAIGAVIRDVTERWQADRALRQELAELRQQGSGTADPGR